MKSQDTTTLDTIVENGTPHFSYCNDMQTNITRKCSCYRVERMESLKSQLLTYIEQLLPEESEKEGFYIGNPNYQCYRLDGHDYDSFGYCRSCKNPSLEAYLRAQTIFSRCSCRNQLLQALEKERGEK